MLKPPFKLATSIATAAAGLNKASPYSPVDCCEAPQANAEAASKLRSRLADLDPHLHCSVIGTCLSTAELRKLMARFLMVGGLSDLEVHHEAVKLASQGGDVVKALHKALDHRHDGVVQRFSRFAQAEALGALWDEALRLGEVPGAYWALLTHRGGTPALRQKAFGEVHMLSHLVGAANRADIRRLVALEHDNADLRDRVERQQLRSQALVDGREQTLAQLRQALAELEGERSAARERDTLPPSTPSDQEPLASILSRVAVQTERRERAERVADSAAREAERLRDELEHLAQHAQTLGRELLAAETQLREIGDGPGAPSRSLAHRLQGQRVFYVGGRPSSTPAIRDLVLRHGGEFQHHDGGLEDRKGLLAAGVGWAQWVVFPVDCIDHDSAGNLKRLCARRDIPFLPLRSASVASFAAALSTTGEALLPAGSRAGPQGCFKHG